MRTEDLVFDAFNFIHALASLAVVPAKGESKSSKFWTVELPAKELDVVCMSMSTAEFNCSARFFKAVKYLT